MIELAKDEPLVLQPAVREIECAAIAAFRAKYPEAQLWQDLDDATRGMWVMHVEKERKQSSKDHP